MTGTTDTKTLLLDTAEELFANLGFHGVSVRMVSKTAGTQLAAVAYHFGTKDELFRAVIERRAAELNAERLSLLARAAAPPVTTERIVTAVIGPLLARATGTDRGWRNYCRLISQTNSSAQWSSLISEYFDDVARSAITLIGKVHPRSTPRQRHACYYFMIGLMTFVFAESGRLDQLTSGDYPSSALDEIYSELVPFLVAGVDRLASSGAPARRRRTAAS